LFLSPSLPLHVQPIDAEAWRRAASTFHDLSYRQGVAYVSHIARQQKSACELVAIVDVNNATIGLAAVRVRNLPLLPTGIAYIHHGPLTLQGKSFGPAIYAACCAALKDHYVDRRGLTLRVVPPDVATLTHPLDDDLAAVGFRRNAAVRHTILLDLNRPIETIRKGLEQKWRNKLNAAEKISGVVITASDHWQDIALMAPMLTDLENKKDFQASQDVAFFTAVQQAAKPPEQLRVYLAQHQGELISASLVDVSGDEIVLLLAATNDKGRDLKTSNRVQWRIIADAVDAGKTWYDLGGIDINANPGVHHFKKGVGGREFAEPGVFEAAPNGALAIATRFAERIYRAIKSKRR
jgi:hypothetical protein